MFIFIAEARGLYRGRETRRNYVTASVVEIATIPGLEIPDEHEARAFSAREFT